MEWFGITKVEAWEGEPAASDWDEDETCTGGDWGRECIVVWGGEGELMGWLDGEVSLWFKEFVGDLDEVGVAEREIWVRLVGVDFEIGIIEVKGWSP